MPVGKRKIVCSLVFSSSFLRIISPAPPSNKTLSGTTMAALPVVLSMLRMCCTKFSCCLMWLPKNLGGYRVGLLFLVYPYRLRSEGHTSELQSRPQLGCRPLPEK